MAARKQDHADLAQMMQAIAWHRLPDSAQAIAAIDRLALAHPDDAFIHELRGQILLESRRVDQAVLAYRRATELAPRNALILAGYGRAMLAAGQPREARDVLERARARDFRNVAVLRDLALAYAKNNERGMASVVTAERYALLGQFADARLHANRALGQVTPGSRAGIRAQDVLSGAEAALAK
jgi:predicted Zn-dependent protease